MKFLFVFAFISLFSFAAFAQTSSMAKSDLDVLAGNKWAGELTYLDYSSNRKTSIKSDLTVTALPAKPGAWTFKYEYPDEPKANSSSEVTLSVDGKMFSGQNVLERSVTAVSTKIVSTKAGTDNDRKALFRFTYTISPKSFTIRKEVQIEGSSEWFERNTYSWSR